MHPLIEAKMKGCRTRGSRVFVSRPWGSFGPASRSALRLVANDSTLHSSLIPTSPPRPPHRACSPRTHYTGSAALTCRLTVPPAPHNQPTHPLFPSIPRPLSSPPAASCLYLSLGHGRFPTIQTQGAPAWRIRRPAFPVGQGQPVVQAVCVVSAPVLQDCPRSSD